MPTLATTPARTAESPWLGIAFTPVDRNWDLARKRTHELAGRLPFAAAGGVPVSLIAGAAFGLDLRILALCILAPVVACLVARMVVDRPTRRLVGRAIAAGVVATACYDVCRGSFLWVGLMDHDPIPHIGRALGLSPAWVAGYTWRYLGNGTGLALTFLSLGLRGRKVGVLYGLMVASCLISTLVISPYGTTVLFPLTVPSVIMIVLGHAIYGGVLGTIAARRHALAGEASDSRIGTLTLSWHPTRSAATQTQLPEPGHEAGRAGRPRHHGLAPDAASSGLGQAC